MALNINPNHKKRRRCCNTKEEEEEDDSIYNNTNKEDNENENENENDTIAGTSRTPTSARTTPPSIMEPPVVGVQQQPPHEEEQDYDKNHSTLSSSSLSDLRLLCCFGKEFIHEIGDGTGDGGTGGGNALLTRGGFGEISIALLSSQQSHPPPPLPNKSGGITTSMEECDNNNTNNELSSLLSCTTQQQWKFVAIKTIEQALVVQQQQSRKKVLSKPIFQELCALQHLQSHSNIIPLWALYSNSSISLIFPYCPIDLQLSFEWRRKTFQPITQQLSLNTILPMIAKDILLGIHHCHSKHVIHCDMKPGNLLITSCGTIQLCDFGLTQPYLPSSQQQHQKQNNNNNQHAMCTLNYRSPEALLGSTIVHPSIDMYSIGTIIGELVTGGYQPLFPGRNVLDQLCLIFSVLGTPSSTETTTTSTTTQHYPKAKYLPDFGKLSFTKQLPQSWTMMITNNNNNNKTSSTPSKTSTTPTTTTPVCSFPRLLECPLLANFLSRLIALDPELRYTSQQALDHEWIQQLDHDDENDNDDDGDDENENEMNDNDQKKNYTTSSSQRQQQQEQQRRRQIQEAFIPDELRPPLSLSLLGCTKDDATRQALSVASHRRRLLMSSSSYSSSSGTDKKNSKIMSPNFWKGPNLSTGTTTGKEGGAKPSSSSLTLNILCDRFVAKLR